MTPYAATLVVTDAEGREVARVVASGDGRFEVPLPAGDYVVVPQAGDPLPVAVPLDVRVLPGRFAEVEVNYDSGIR